MPAGGRSDHHEYAWSLPPLPDDGGGLAPGPRRAGHPATLPAPDRPGEPPRPRVRGPGQGADGVGPGVARGTVRGRLAGGQGGRAGLGLPGGRLHRGRPRPGGPAPDPVRQRRAGLPRGRLPRRPAPGHRARRAPPAGGRRGDRAGRGRRPGPAAGHRRPGPPGGLGRRPRRRRGRAGQPGRAAVRPSRPDQAGHAPAPGPHHREAAHIVNTVRAQAERTDALVIAEGIETIKHAREAAAAGATIGQGFLFGHPAPLPSEMPPPTEAIPLRQARPATPDATPWEVVASAREARRVTKDLLAETSLQLEHQGLDAAEPNVLLAGFQEVGQFSPAIQSRYEFLATRAAFTGALGHGMPVTPVAGVRGADLAANDPLRGEWALIVIGPRFAAALVAHDLGDDRPDDQRRYDMVVTHDRELVIRAAEPLLRRLVPNTDQRGIAGAWGV